MRYEGSFEKNEKGEKGRQDGFPIGSASFRRADSRFRRVSAGRAGVFYRQRTKLARSDFRQGFSGSGSLRPWKIFGDAPRRHGGFLGSAPSAFRRISPVFPRLRRVFVLDPSLSSSVRHRFDFFRPAFSRKGDPLRCRGEAGLLHGPEPCLACLRKEQRPLSVSSRLRDSSRDSRHSVRSSTFALLVSENAICPFFEIPGRMQG